MQILQPGFRKYDIEDFNKLLKKVHCNGDKDIKGVFNVHNHHFIEIPTLLSWFDVFPKEQKSQN